MKKLFLFFLIIYTISFKTQEIDKTFYLLGAISEYPHRIYSERNQINSGYIVHFHQGFYEKEIVRLEEIVGIKFIQAEKVVKCGNCHEFKNLISLDLEKEINRYCYIPENINSKKSFSPNQNIEKVLDSNKNQQESYLLGSFLMYGYIDKQSKNYVISVANNHNKFEILKHIILNFDNKIIKTEILKNIPKIYKIEFYPNKKLKNLIDLELQNQTDKDEYLNRRFRKSQNLKPETQN